MIQFHPAIDDMPKYIMIISLKMENTLDGKDIAPNSMKLK